MYQLTGVTKTYKKGRDTVEALRGVDLTIEDREWLAIQGPTGHGKSTLLQILGGLDRPTSGSAVLDGKDLAALREGQVTKVRATSIGFIFQTFNLIPTLSAQENVEAALVPLHIHGAQRRAWAAQSLVDVGLGDRLRHLPSELSGGQQQRVAIARALVKKPTVLLADEPTGNLDEGTRDEIIALLEKLWKDLGLTLILVTHDSSVARRAQRVGQMRDGRLLIRQDTRRGPQARVAAGQADPGGPPSVGPAALAPGGTQPRRAAQRGTAGLAPGGTQPRRAAQRGTRRVSPRGSTAPGTRRTPMARNPGGLRPRPFTGPLPAAPRRLAGRVSFVG